MCGVPRFSWVYHIGQQSKCWWLVAGTLGYRLVKTRSASTTFGDRADTEGEISPKVWKYNSKKFPIGEIKHDVSMVTPDNMFPNESGKYLKALSEDWYHL